MGAGGCRRSWRCSSAEVWWQHASTATARCCTRVMPTSVATASSGCSKQVLPLSLTPPLHHITVNLHWNVLFLEPQLGLRSLDGDDMLGSRIGEDYVSETKGLLLRASLLQHDLVQRSSVPHVRGPGRPSVPDRF